MDPETSSGQLNPDSITTTPQYPPLFPDYQYQDYGYSQYGWICPRCYTVHAPWVAQCGCPSYQFSYGTTSSTAVGIPTNSTGDVK